MEQFSKEAQTLSPGFPSLEISENCGALTLNSRSRSQGTLLSIPQTNITNRVPQWSQIPSNPRHRSAEKTASDVSALHRNGLRSKSYGNGIASQIQSGFRVEVGHKSYQRRQNIQFMHQENGSPVVKVFSVYKSCKLAHYKKRAGAAVIQLFYICTNQSELQT